MVHEEAGICSTLYGPVSSRRLGLSLGINLGLPQKKVCTWGCVYCQCGFGERREIAPYEESQPTREEVLRLLRLSLSKETRPLDSLTFAGNSEPCNHPEFPQIVRDVLKLKFAMRAQWIVNILTNGSELDRPEIVTACNQLDEAWIKLDCGTEELFRRLSRPIEKVGSLKQHLERLKKLNNLRIQCLLWQSVDEPEISNWTRQNQDALLQAFLELKPKEIHLTTVRRAPAVASISAVPLPELQAFGAEILRQGLKVQVFP